MASEPVVSAACGSHGDAPKAPATLLLVHNPPRRGVLPPFDEHSDDLPVFSHDAAASQCRRPREDLPGIQLSRSVKKYHSTILIVDDDPNDLFFIERGVKVGTIPP